MPPVIGTLVVKVVAPEVRPVRVLGVKDSASTAGEPAHKAQTAANSAILGPSL